MRAALRRLLLLALSTDSLARCGGDTWTTRCLHCNAHLRVRADGEALGVSSLEHVVPQAWFGKRAAASLTARVGDNAADPRNLAIACGPCNHGKGTRHDARGPAEPRARTVVSDLLDTRLARWRDMDPESADPRIG